jgi:hypothetical protein
MKAWNHDQPLVVLGFRSSVQSREYTYALSKLRAVSTFRRDSLLFTLWSFTLGISQMVERWRERSVESNPTEYRAVAPPERNPSGSEVDVYQRCGFAAYFCSGCRCGRRRVALVPINDLLCGPDVGIVFPSLCRCRAGRQETDTCTPASCK